MSHTDHTDPVLPYRVNRDRLFVSAENKIVDTPPTVRDDVLQRSLRWMVAVVQCPYCGQEHEHVMSQYAGWGRYRAHCLTDDRGYYLLNE